MYYAYGSVWAIPTYRVYRRYDGILSLHTLDLYFCSLLISILPLTDITSSLSYSPLPPKFYDFHFVSPLFVLPKFKYCTQVHVQLTVTASGSVLVDLL